MVQGHDETCQGLYVIEDGAFKEIKKEEEAENRSAYLVENAKVKAEGIHLH